MKNAIEAVGVGTAHGKRRVLHGVHLNIAAGCWTSVIGPNGAGKSTLLNVLAGLMPHEGQVRLPLCPAHGPKDKAKYLSWLGQHEKGADDLTVYDLAMLGRLPHCAWLAPPSEHDHAAVKHALERLDVWQWRARSVGQLSGGERQRVLLARALAVEAQVLFMDEPLVNLDPPHQVDWVELVRTLVKQGKTVVSVLHDISLALLADHMVVLANGQVLHHGACDSADTHQAVEQVFDQRIHIQHLAGQWCALPRF
jgi:iron complex transport system ATP-binding protein